MSEDALEHNSTKDYLYSYESKNLKTLNFSDTISKVREKVAPYRFRLAARNISRELHLEGEENVLEVGSGLGLLGKAIGEEVGGNINYFGIELAYNPAVKSKEQAITPTQANAVRLPFKNETFDAVVSTDVLEHVTQDKDAVNEMYRVLKPGGKAFIAIADPSEGRFNYVGDHINRTKTGSDVEYWENNFKNSGFKVLEDNSKKYRSRDWRKIFNLPFLVKFKDKPGFACAINPINRPGTYVLQKQ